MPLFNALTAKGYEVPAMLALADRLSECDQFQELAEAADATAARAKIFLGPIPEPFDSEEFTVDELQGVHLWARIAPADDEGHEGVSPETFSPCPDESGNIEIYIRRQVRATEASDIAGRQDVYMFFLDRVGAITHQLFEQAFTAGSPKLNSVRREFSPSFASIAEEVAQGEYIWASAVVDWGERGAA